MHEINIKVITANTYENLKKKMGEVEDQVARTISHDDDINGYDYYKIGPVRNSYKSYANYNEAYDDLFRLADNSSDTVYGTYKFPRSSKYITLEKRLYAEKDKYNVYYEAHMVCKQNAQYIGCKSCGSKINKKFLKKTNDCPVCGDDLRAKTTVDTLARYNSNIRSLEKELSAEKQAMQKQKTMSKNDGTYYIAAIYIDRHC